MFGEDRFNLGRWPSLHVRWRPEQIALQEGDTRRTYRELAARVDRLGYALQSRGVRFGDRVALLVPARVETIELILACARIGAIAVPLNFRLVPRELAFMLRDSGAKMIFWDAAFSTLVDGLKAEELPADLLWTEIGAELEAFVASVPEQVPAHPTQPVTEDTPHLIMYTAGTTGLPKGVVLTHGNTFWQTMNAVNLGLMPGVVGLATLPLFHVGGLNGSVLPLLFIGGTVVIQKQFSPLETLALIQTHKIQGMVGVPAMFQMMAAMPTFASTDLSSVIAFTSGGAPLPLHTIELYRARGIVFRQGYGLTEAAPGVTGMEPQDAFLKIGSVGRPCHHTEVRVVDEHDADCPPGVAGEVIVRGPNIMPGYWNRPQESAETLRGGWLRTGDAGHFDADGYLFVAGRIKEMIITGGENVYPAEVVNALMEHPSVADAAVIGMPDEKWGQRPVAFIVAWPGKPVDAEGLGGYLEGRLARYKHPREYHFIPALPRNATGKVVRAGLVEILEGLSR
ncbi:long-chain fatty acid--CoA ligase [Myxococcota bacterium]|nr:long-chain fatty acid--CoA ligase [Myxococcota bacterium]